MKTKNIAAVLAVAALAVPAGVAAKGPSGTHGKSGAAHAKNQLKQQNKPNHVNSRCKHQPLVGFSIRGTLDPSSTASAVVIDVTSANRHSKPWVSGGKYSVPSGQQLTFTGSNPFTTQGADFTKYNVKLNGKVVKLKNGCTAASSPQPTIKKVTITAPDAQQ